MSILKRSNDKDTKDYALFTGIQFQYGGAETRFALPAGGSWAYGILGPDLAKQEYNGKANGKGLGWTKDWPDKNGPSIRFTEDRQHKWIQGHLINALSK